eukprot:CAMPEP_0168455152 /NCGR_PEP_ID=MMETSP0228-20121227/50601_1 /TAXON_ID=133427 /ORGANISM="Protoceratium reticulatum, Strain CCCM 535 (=CCMP 1889)" /LENGTH=168 /DNA_ID=CAMNT_0008469985 /DNA_START=189 /DNA_END=697 /DNA_ORIENTATION=+
MSSTDGLKSNLRPMGPALSSVLATPGCDQGGAGGNAPAGQPVPGSRHKPMATPGQELAATMAAPASTPRPAAVLSPPAGRGEAAVPPLPSGPHNEQADAQGDPWEALTNLARAACLLQVARQQEECVGPPLGINLGHGLCEGYAQPVHVCVYVELHPAPQLEPEGAGR